MAVMVVVAWRRGRWLVAAHVWLAIDVMRLCAMPGPLGLVDGGRGGAFGAVRSSSLQRHCVVVAIGGSQRACGWRLMSRACAQCQGLWMVVWGGCHWCHPIIFAAVASCGCGRWWVTARSFHAISVTLLHNARGSPGCRGSVGGGACPMNVVGSAPSHHCAGVGP